MKKREIYKLAQVAVIESELPGYTKLEILRELMQQEDLARYCEEQEAAKE